MTETEAKIEAIIKAVQDAPRGDIMIPCSAETFNYYARGRLNSALFKRTWREERRHYPGMSKREYLLEVWWPKRGVRASCITL
jgi:hypothetical protein